MKKVFDFFFPTAPKEEEVPEIEKVEADVIAGNVDALKLKSDIAYRGYKEEFERMRATEGKASIFISTTGFLATIVVGVTTLLVKVEHVDSFVLLLIFITGVLTFYMMRTIIYSVRAMRRQSFLRVDPASITNIANEENQLKENIADYINAVNINKYVINRKVELSAMAQAYFKRAITSLVFYVIALFLFAIKNSNIPIATYYKIVSKEISTWTFNNWYVYITSTLLIISLIMSGIALYKTTQKPMSNL